MLQAYLAKLEDKRRRTRQINLKLGFSQNTFDFVMSLPKMAKIRQKISNVKVRDLVNTIRNELRLAGLYEKVHPNMRVAITAGSRGIACYSVILRTVVEEVKKAGGEPFLVPTMGSHGGATSEGQIQILRSLGITPERIGAPICSSMETEELGKLEDGEPVHVDKMALSSDGIIVVNRVKPHTDFKDRIESGLMKMMAIGLGNQKGAEMIHRHQSEGYHKRIPAVARLVIDKAPILIGLAIVENAHHEVAIVKALNPEEIEAKEAKLLVKAKALLARIPFKEIDVLIVDEIGKNISGLGMDTNVIGRFWIPGEDAPDAPKIKRIVVLDLSDESHGNAMGIGLADLTTTKLVNKIDFCATATNCLTDCWPELGKIPVHLQSDFDAILAALRVSGSIDEKRAKIVRIRNTIELDQMWVSENLYESIKSDPELSRRLEVLDEPREMQFDSFGMLAK